MYLLDPNPSFWKTIKVRVPGEGAGEETFRARFIALDAEEFDSFDLRTPEGTRDFLTRTLSETDDIVDANKKPIPWSPELRAALLRAPHIRMALVKGYLDAFREALAGN